MKHIAVILKKRMKWMKSDPRIENETMIIWQLSGYPMTKSKAMFFTEKFNGKEPKHKGKLHSPLRR